MPIIACALIITAIVFLVRFPESRWLGFLFLGLGIFTVLMFIGIRIYFNKKIKELEKDKGE